MTESRLTRYTPPVFVLHACRHQDSETVWNMAVEKRAPRSRKRLIAAGLGLLALALLVALLFSPLFGSVSPALGLSAAELPRTVVATGLLNPRGLAFGPDGSLYVAEAGAAGREHIKVTKGERQDHVCKTGRGSPLPGDGTRSVVANGMPSALSADDDDIGPTGITVLDGAIYVLTAAG